MRRFVAVLLSVFAVAATGVVGFALAGPVRHQAATVTDVSVHMGEYYFTLDKSSAPAGTVVFHVVNDGDLGHDFAIAGQHTPVIEKGQTATLTVNFNAAGGFNYVCTVGEHAVYGMTGNFQITGGGGGTTVVTTNGTTVVNTTPPPPPPKITANLKVTEKEFKILITQAKKVRVKKGRKTVTVTKDVPVKSVPAGRVRFAVRNVGKLPHNFVIGTTQTSVLKSKQAQTVTATLTTKGAQHFECSITGHAAAGMKGNLKIS